LRTIEEGINTAEEALIMHTDFMGEKKKIDIKDGKCVVDDKEFIVDRVQPIMLRQRRLGRTTIKPLYFLKWDKVEPAHFVIDEKEIDGEMYAEIKDKYILKSIEAAFPEKSKDDVLPHYVRETFDMRFLKNMKKYATDGKAGISFKRWMLIPVAFLISGGFMFLLYYTGILR
jgi:hypothetical protein